MFGSSLTQAVLALTVIGLAFLVRFLVQFHVHRTRMRGLPGPPHSYFWGHIQSIREVMATLPSTAHSQLMPLKTKERFDLGEVFYLDTFPFAPPSLVITDIEVMKSITTYNSLPKHRLVCEFVDWLGGPQNLVTLEGSAWKRWRSAFNPGFSAKHIMSLVPAIVDETQVFCDLMTEKAKKQELFRLERVATKLTVDIIGKVVLDVALDSQRGPNTLVDSMLSFIKWMELGNTWMNPFAILDIRGSFILRYHTWKMNRYLSRIIEDRFATRHTRQKSKAIIDLALDVYIKETKGIDAENVAHLDPDFKIAAMSNMKTFIFAGHDTTSTGIAYALYYLFKYPDMLAKIRKEHDDVFGSDPADAANRLREDPYLLNKLNYTTAVIREVLRFQPPASTLRAGSEAVYLHHPETGQALPTDGTMIWPLDVGIHRNAKYWPNPHVFDPERHLPPASSENSTTNNNKEAWIPFSNGPRNCIGQELAMVETKILLVLAIRTFDFVPAFDEAYKLKDDGSGYKVDNSGVKSIYGDEAYQVAFMTAKPRDGMPCRLTLRA